jgi:adenosylhomocysteinase
VHSSGSSVKDPTLAPEGHRKIDWAARHSPVLNAVREKYLKDGSFEGLGVGVALPIEAKTAYLTVVLAEAGAEVAVAAPGPYFVQDDVAAAPGGAGRDGLRFLSEPAGGGRPGARTGAGPGIGRQVGRPHRRPGRARAPRAHNAPQPVERSARRVGGDDRAGWPKFRAMELEGVPGVPGHRRQRRPVQVPLRQPLRHRPIHSDGDNAEHEPDGRRQARSRPGLRVVRQGYRPATPRA